MTRPLVLVTGFGAFTGVPVNPSGAVALSLASLGPEAVGGARILGRELPVTFAGAPRAIEEFMEVATERPLALLGLGVHRKDWWRLESRARARPCSVKPDNDGVLGADVDDPRKVDGALRTSFDLGALADTLSASGAGDVRTSDDAGGYVCEWVYRHLLEHGERLAVPALFLHVPPVAEVPVPRQVEVVASLVQAMVGQLAER